jgi:hypothetical protein
MNLYIRNFITVLIAFCCFSCDINDNLGPEVIGGDQYSEGYLIDTFSIVSYNTTGSEISTRIISGSSNTNSSIGEYNDPLFGNASASFIGRLELPNARYSVSDELFIIDTIVDGTDTTFEYSGDVTYDAISLTFHLNSFYGDNSNNQGFYVVRLAERIDSANAFYGNETLQIKDTIGHAIIDPVTAQSHSKVSIALDEWIATSFFRTITSGSHLDDQSILDGLFTSLAIIPDDKDLSKGIFVINPYSANSGLEIEYVELGVTKQTIIKFDQTDIVGHAAYDNTPSATASAYYSDTTSGSDTVYLRGLYSNGLIVKIPHIDQLSGVVVQAADLFIPVLDDPTNEDYLRPNQIITFNDKFEASGFSKLYFVSELVSETVNGVVKYYYKLDITEYIYKYLQDVRSPKEKGIEIIIDPDLPDRVLLGGNEKIKLNLIVTDLN